MSTNPTPPSYLSPARKTLWRHVVRSYDLRPQHLELLRLACEALDRCEEARKTIAAEGAFTTNRYGGRVAHPAITVERDSRLAAARLLRELGLEDDHEEV